MVLEHHLANAPQSDQREIRRVPPTPRTVHIDIRCHVTTLLDGASSICVSATFDLLGRTHRSYGEAAFLLDEAGDLISASSRVQIGKYKRTGPAHLLGIAFHHLK